MASDEEVGREESASAETIWGISPAETRTPSLTSLTRAQYYLRALLGVDHERAEAERAARYDALAARFLQHDEPSDDPLLATSTVEEGASTSQNWSMLFYDLKLSKEIEKDVSRLVSDATGEPLHDRPTREALARVLYVWTKQRASEENSDADYSNMFRSLASGGSASFPSKYRQGMHELLSFLHASLAPAEPTEAQIYWGFHALMTKAECFYEINTRDQKSALLKACWNVHHRFLSKAAPDLHHKLATELGLEPVYCIRWMRCLFTRDLQSETCLVVWDALLAQSFFGEMAFTDAVTLMCVAMLMHARGALLTCRTDAEAMAVLQQTSTWSRVDASRDLVPLAVSLVVLCESPGTIPMLQLQGRLWMSPEEAEDDRLQVRMGKRLLRAVSELERELTAPTAWAGAASAHQSRALQIVAQLKQIHDVLLERIHETDCSWWDETRS